MVPMPWDREMDRQLSPGWTVYVVPVHWGVAVGALRVASAKFPFFGKRGTYMVTQVVVVASGVTDIDEIPQLEVKDSYWLFNWLFVAPIGIWSCVLMREAAQVWHAILGATVVSQNNFQQEACCTYQQ
jgi:hypothetical protein